MSSKVFIFHGWDSSPEKGWFPWLKSELERRGFLVFVPQLPQAEEPRIGKWIPAIKELVGLPDEETFFVGHSMGCQAIARFLEGLPEGTKVGGAIFVAGFFKNLSNLEDDAVTRSVAAEWLKTPLDLDKVRSHLKNSVAIFSDNDPYVPLENQDEYQNILGSKIILQHGMKHFSGSTGTVELPAVLDSLLEMAQL